MLNLKVTFLLIGLTLVACSDNDEQTLLGNNSNSVVFLKQDVKVDLNIDNTYVPSEIIRTLKLLDFKANDKVQKPLGFNAAEKIKIFPIHAYLKYNDGWIIASGRGEWGGIVYWLSKEGDYKVLRDDDLAYPIDVMKDDNTILITQGMPGLGLSGGHLFEVIRTDDDFKTHVYPVQGYTNNIERFNGELIVSDNGSYYLVRELRAGKNLLHPFR